MLDDPNSQLNALRWDVDQKVINHFADEVWLKALIQDGKRLGITECCFTSDPCSHHKAIQEQQDQAAKN